MILYIGIPERANQFKEAGIEIAGTVEDMIQEADVVVDCTPGTIGPQNLEMYKKKLELKQFTKVEKTMN